MLDIKKKRSSKKESTSSGGPERKKGKPTHNHVESRRYRFKNFNERIEEIEISSIQRIGGYHGTGPKSTDTTWFELSLDAWKELNCSAAFAKFCWSVTPLTGTLPKLLFNRKKIVEEIFGVLRAASGEGPESPARLALIPVLSLTAMLAKDLGPEFQEFFAEFFVLLAPILPSSTDPEIIEAAFASLLYVFKCLLPGLLIDLPGTFEIVAKPLLSAVDSKGHLRRFGAECFGYLLRKSLKISDSGLFEAIQAVHFPNTEEFVADTFVAAILDDSTGRFRTCLKPLYLEIFGYIKRTNSQCWINILRFTSVKLIDETDLNTNAPLWKIFVQLLNNLSEEVKVSDVSSNDLIEKDCLTAVLIDCFAYRRGTRTQLHSTILPGILKLKSIELTAYVLRSMNLEITLQNRPLALKIVENVLEGKFENLIVLCKFLVKLNWLQYDLLLRESVGNYLKEAIDSKINDELILNLLEILLQKYFNASNSLGSIPVVLETLSRLALKSDNEDESLRVLKILLEHFPSKFPLQLIPNLTENFINFFVNPSSGSLEKLKICTEVICSNFITKIDSSHGLNEEILLIFLVDNLKYPEQLKAVSGAIKTFGISVADKREKFIEILLPCLRSSNSNWRLEALDLLENIEKSNCDADDANVIINLLQKIENVPSDLENYREKLLQLKKLEHLTLLKEAAPVHSARAKLIINFLLGFLQIKLSLLWTEGNRVLSRFALAYPLEFSEIMTEIFTTSNVMIKGIEGVTEENLSISSSSSGYEVEIDDEALKHVKSIRKEILNSNVKDQMDQKDPGDKELNVLVPINEVNLLVPTIMKLFAAHPEQCLSSSNEFREQIFIPLIIEIFSLTSLNSNLPKTNAATCTEISISSLIQNNLGQALQALAGTKIDPIDQGARYTSNQLEGVLLRFLAHGDLQLQNRAIDAILMTKKYGGALSNQWKGRLRALLNDNLFREELTSLTSEASALPRACHWHTLLAPLIVRILFGRFIARKGASAGRHSLPLRRKMIMNCFGTWDEGSLAFIVDFLIESKGDKSNSQRQIGFLNVLGDVLGSLGRKLDPQSMDRLITSLLEICEMIGNLSAEIENDVNDDEDESEVNDKNIIHDEEIVIETVDQSNTFLKPHLQDRRIRQLAMKRLLQLFKIFESSSMARLQNFLPSLFEKVLNPRIQQLPTHFTQSTTSSALLDILVCMATWLNETDLLEILLNWSPELWKNSVEAFANESTKPLIISQLLTFFEGIVLKAASKSSFKSTELLEKIVIPGMGPLLDAFDFRLKKNATGDPRTILRIVALSQSLAPHVTSPELAARLCKTFEGLLRIRTINESVRTHLLSAMIELLKISDINVNASVLTISLFEIASAQWNVLKGRPGREALCKLFECFATLEASNSSNSSSSLALENLSGLLKDLNSWLPGKISEPNFDLRLSAFARLRKSIDSGEFCFNLTNDPKLVTALYTPIAYAMVYFLNDIDELSIRNQSFGVLKALINQIKMDASEIIAVSAAADNDDKEDEESEEHELSVPITKKNFSMFGLVQRILLPGVKSGLKSRAEIIRIEFTALLDLLIAAFPQRHPFAALFALIQNSSTQDEDEENIFRNIYHIQEPRRNRAIRLIGEMAGDGRLKGLTRGIIEDLLMPLILSTTLPDPNGEIEFTVSEAMQKDSIATCGSLMAQLPWRAFLRKLIQFVREIGENKKSEQWSKAVLRLLPAMISQFKWIAPEEERNDFAARINEDVLPVMFRLLHRSESTKQDAISENSAKKAKTSNGAPLIDKISVKHSLRVPIAISIGQLIKLVSRGSLDAPVVLTHLPKLLTDLLNVLKQKDADTRDVARGALVKILGTFGTAYLPFFLREARTMLNRGYQRHVLTFTAHAVLVELMRRHKQEGNENETLEWSLDASADLLVDMALASSFGFQASERATIEWSGKQPEVRAARGPEIIALITQFTSPAIFEKSLILKIIQLASLELNEIGTLNTRGTGALDEKAEAIDRIEGATFDLLLRSLFSNGIYTLLARDSERLPSLLSLMYDILNRPCEANSRSHLHRLQARAFEFISHLLNNFKNDETDEIFMGRICPFVALTRVYILETGKHVVALTSAISLFNQFIACKSLHPSITDLQPLLQKLFTIILKGNSGNTTEGSSQLSAAFKLTSTLIRDWSDLQVNDTQIKALIEYTRMQLDNPHQQSLTFSLIRSLISRQVVLLQLFELMETVRTVMLTSHHPTTRQQCRAAFIHFLINYPMATRKLEEQLEFLLTNVRYEFATGRESCVDVICGLIGKLPLEVIENFAEAWFVGLAVQLSKESDSGVSTAILKTISILFTRLGEGKRRDNLELLLSRWITQSPKLSVQAAAWKMFSPILLEISGVTRDILIKKGIDLIGEDSDSDLLRIILKITNDLIKKNLCSTANMEEILIAASQSKFFKNDCELEIRHSIALIWNSILT